MASCNPTSRAVTGTRAQRSRGRVRRSALDRCARSRGRVERRVDRPEGGGHALGAADQDARTSLRTNRPARSAPASPCPAHERRRQQDRSLVAPGREEAVSLFEGLGSGPVDLAGPVAVGRQVEARGRCRCRPGFANRGASPARGRTTRRRARSGRATRAGARGCCGAPPRRRRADRARRGRGRSAARSSRVAARTPRPRLDDEITDAADRRPRREGRTGRGRSPRADRDAHCAASFIGSDRCPFVARPFRSRRARWVSADGRSRNRSTAPRAIATRIRSQPLVISHTRDASAVTDDLGAEHAE